MPKIDLFEDNISLAASCIMKSEKPTSFDYKLDPFFSNKDNSTHLYKLYFDRRVFKLYKTLVTHLSTEMSQCDIKKLVDETLDPVKNWREVIHHIYPEKNEKLKDDHFLLLEIRMIINKHLFNFEWFNEYKFIEVRNFATLQIIIEQAENYLLGGPKLQEKQLTDPFDLSKDADRYCYPIEDI